MHLLFNTFQQVQILRRRRGGSTIVVQGQRIRTYEQIIEKIVFDEDELTKLKEKIRDLVEGKIQAKQLKQSLLQSRDRIVKDLSKFLIFCIDRVESNNKNRNLHKSSAYNQSDLEYKGLRKDIAEKNELLEIVAEKVNKIVSSVKHTNKPEIS